jgi:hypothetical protein
MPRKEDLFEERNMIVEKDIPILDWNPNWDLIRTLSLRNKEKALASTQRSSQEKDSSKSG